MPTNLSSLISFETASKLNPSGSGLLYSTYLGGSDNESANGVVLDGNGDAFITGTTSSTNFPTAGNPFQSLRTGQGNAFVVELSASGTVVYGTYLGSTGFDQANAIAVDSSGNAYVAGWTNGVDFPTRNAFQNRSSGGIDAFVSKLDATGSSLVYSTYLGGNNTDTASGIAVDNLGNAYIAGSTLSPDYPTHNAFQGNLRGSGVSNAFVTKLSSVGDMLLYSTYLGGTGGDAANGIAVDLSGNAYVAGSTGSSNFPTVGPFQPGYAGQGDAFIAKLNAAGSSLQYSTYLGGGKTDYAQGIAVDTAGNAYVTGFTQSSDFRLASALQPGWAGGDDAFVAKLTNYTWRPVDVGIGSDGNARLLWDAPDHRAIVWSIAGMSTVSAGPAAGPFSGWTGQAAASGSSDGLTRVLWRNGNRAAELWLVNPDGTFQKGTIFGPFDGWAPLDVAVGADNRTRLLWKNINGAAEVWTVDDNLNATAFSPVFGPLSGWTPRSVDVGASDGLIRLLWTHVDGAVALWLLSPTGAFVTGAVYTPPAGWTPQDVTGGSGSSTEILWTKVNGAAAIWTLNGTLALTSSTVYGPLGNWSAARLAMSPDGSFRLLWENLDGSAAVWSLSSTNVFQGAGVFGPVL